MLSEEKVLELLESKLRLFIITNNDVYLESVFTLRDVLGLSNGDIDKMYREIEKSVCDDVHKTIEEMKKVVDK